MNQDLFELEQEFLDQALARARGTEDDNWAAYQALVSEYRRLLSQSRRLIRVGHTLEKQRILQVEAKNAELLALHQSYARFVPREILDLLLKRDITEIGLGDHLEFEAAILFADIRGFTTLAESLSPERVFQLLNAYLRTVSPIIKTWGGVVDKILGDGLMAYFPQATEEALAAALDIQSAVEAFNRDQCVPEFGFALEVGIGLHTGPCILGTLGEADRMDTTVVSDAVNVASRIEGLTKLYRCPILISQDIFQRSFFSQNVVFRFVDSVRLKGKNDSTSVYEARSRESLEAADLSYIDQFERAAFAFHEGRTEEARDQFDSLLRHRPDDASLRMYLDRCTVEIPPYPV